MKRNASGSQKSDVVLDALLEARAAMRTMRDQIEQMRGMFNDSDGAIQAACDDHDAVAKRIDEAIAACGGEEPSCAGQRPGM